MGRRKAKSRETWVEVSGWDLNDRFFVHKSQVEDNGHAKVVLIGREVEPGATLFLRPLAPPDSDSASLPVVYSVLQTRRDDGRRGWQVTIVKLWPGATISERAK